MCHGQNMVSHWARTSTRCGRAGLMGSLPIESCHWSNGRGIISNAFFSTFSASLWFVHPNGCLHADSSFIGRQQVTWFRWTRGHLWFFLVILQPFVPYLGIRHVQKATVHQVLGSLRTWNLFEWLGQVVDPWITQTHLRDYRVFLRRERLVYGICMCRIVERCCENAVASYGWMATVFISLMSLLIWAIERGFSCLSKYVWFSTLITDLVTLLYVYAMVFSLSKGQLRYAAVNCYCYCDISLVYGQQVVAGLVLSIRFTPFYTSYPLREGMKCCESTCAVFRHNLSKLPRMRDGWPSIP